MQAIVIGRSSLDDTPIEAEMINAANWGLVRESAFGPMAGQDQLVLFNGLCSRPPKDTIITLAEMYINVTLPSVLIDGSPLTRINLSGIWEYKGPAEESFLVAVLLELRRLSKPALVSLHPLPLKVVGIARKRILDWT